MEVTMEYVNANIQELLAKPVWQMTGQEFCTLQKYALSEAAENRVKRISGLQELSEYVGCGVSQLCKIKKTGALDRAILSGMGRSIIFDGDAAREAVRDYWRANRRTAG